MLVVSKIFNNISTLFYYPLHLSIDILRTYNSTSTNRQAFVFGCHRTFKKSMWVKYFTIWKVKITLIDHSFRCLILYNCLLLYLIAKYIPIKCTIPETTFLFKISYQHMRIVIIEFFAFYYRLVRREDEFVSLFVALIYTFRRERIT